MTLYIFFTYISNPLLTVSSPALHKHRTPKLNGQMYMQEEILRLKIFYIDKYNSQTVTSRNDF